MRSVLLRACMLGSLAMWPSASTAAFEIPQPGHRFEFPQDYGAHPGFRIEWWYLTGHLFSEGAPARRFGFEATFFRFDGPQEAPEPNPDFSVREVYLAHMAVTDVDGKRFISEARVNRAGWDARAAVGKLDLANGNWSLLMDPKGRIGVRGGVRADAGFELTWSPAKPVAIFGENGVSRKGAEPSAASYYLTFSRLLGGGTLTLGAETFRVQGEAWMDHEISSSQLGQGQVGWDWTCIQFTPAFSRSPWELMLYRMRRADGTADPYSRLQWVNPAGKVIDEPFTWKVLSWWTSPKTQARYPSTIQLTTTDPRTHRDLVLQLQPLLQDQELPNTIGGGPYWEGACTVLDSLHHPIGNAYLELTGYAHPLRI